MNQNRLTKGLKVLAVIVAAGSIAVAVIIIYNSIPERKTLRFPAKAVVVRPTTRVIEFQVPSVKPRAFRAIGPASALALNAREPELVNLDSSCSLLLRELARQSVLMAARHGLGMPTRDCTLREGSLGPIIGDDAVAPNSTVLEVVASAIKGKSLRICVSGAAKDGSTRKLIDTEVPLTGEPRGVVDYAAVTSSLEALSRSAFPAALKEAGYSAPPGPRTRGAGTPDVDDIEKCLGEMSLVS